MADVSDYFDSNQEAINYAGNLDKQKAKNSKFACKQKCIYQEDCPCNWNINICSKLNQ